MRVQQLPVQKGGVMERYLGEASTTGFQKEKGTSRPSCLPGHQSLRSLRVAGRPCSIDLSVSHPVTAMAALTATVQVREIAAQDRLQTDKLKRILMGEVSASAISSP